MFGLRRRSADVAVPTVGSRPALTARWLRDAIFAHRIAFEREMRRDRHSLERRFNDYIAQESTRED